MVSATQAASPLPPNLPLFTGQHGTARNATGHGVVHVVEFPKGVVGQQANIAESMGGEAVTGGLFVLRSG